MIFSANWAQTRQPTMALFRSDAPKVNVHRCMTSGAVAATALMILCALFTLATVNFGSSLEQLLGAQITKDGAYWDTSRINHLPPLVKDSVDESMGRDSSGTAAGTTTNWGYGVCLLVAMGSTTERRARLPYSDLYRIFNAAKSVTRRKRVFAATDSDPTIFCRMIRDALGAAAECATFNRSSTRVITTSTLIKVSNGPTSSTKRRLCEHLVVGVTEKYTPQPSSSEVHRYGFEWGRVHRVDLDAEDEARKPPALPESEWRPTIVTAFSSNHVEVGLLLLRSLGRVASQQSEFNVSVVVWTMGQFPTVALQALACVVAELRSAYKVPTEVRAFPFNAWPSWMHIDQKKGYNGGRGEYAWKAVMIHTILVERGFVYWADAGDRFRSVSGLTHTLRNVKEHGFASRHSSGQVQQWTHPMQLEYLAANNDHVKTHPNCDASGIGFTLQSYSKLARPWYECSITRQCIAPEGSSRANHRQDQAALTVVVVVAGAECAGVGSGVANGMDSLPRGYRIGVDATKCYKDPLRIKWQLRKLR